MLFIHHDIDPYPIPKDKAPMFINEPWLIDNSIYTETYESMKRAAEPDSEVDNIRVYIPMDINRKSILRRLNAVIAAYGEANEANEANELDFRMDVERLISQIEIYDQIWYLRHVPADERQKHSAEAIELV